MFLTLKKKHEKNYMNRFKETGDSSVNHTVLADRPRYQILISPPRFLVFQIHLTKNYRSSN